MDSSRNATKVGLFVFLALMVIALLLVNFSKGRSLLTPSYRVVIRAENVGGLKAGAAVLVSGVPVGTVEVIELNADGRTVAITTRILKKFTIYADARFEVEQSGFLGDQYISVVPTKNEKEALKDGAVVRAQVPFNLQGAARSAMGLGAGLGAGLVWTKVWARPRRSHLLQCRDIFPMAPTARHGRSGTLAAPFRDTRVPICDRRPPGGGN